MINEITTNLGLTGNNKESEDALAAAFKQAFEMVGHYSQVAPPNQPTASSNDADSNNLDQETITDNLSPDYRPCPGCPTNRQVNEGKGVPNGKGIGPPREYKFPEPPKPPPPPKPPKKNQ